MERIVQHHYLCAPDDDPFIDSKKFTRCDFQIHLLSKTTPIYVNYGAHVKLDIMQAQTYRWQYVVSKKKKT